MSHFKPIQSALISVYHKTGLEPVVRALAEQNVTIYSTGGTQSFIEGLGLEVVPVEDLTNYPSILGGRVKTLHPKIFGGILNRQETASDLAEMEQYGIPNIDLVIVDLYPFEATVASGAALPEIIEKIDIGGISLIRAGAKNYMDTVILPEQSAYSSFLEIYLNKKGTDLNDRKKWAAQAFAVSSHYDTHIFRFLNGEVQTPALKISELQSTALRYGENPHQQGAFFGPLDDLFDQLNGKELSYNNLLDVSAAVALMAEFQNDAPTFAILKHNNACGLATRDTLTEAYQAALQADPVSAFGGILIANQNIDLDTAREINELFAEVVIAPSFNPEAVELLKSKKNRILLVQKLFDFPQQEVRSALNGYLVQNRDTQSETAADLKTVTKNAPTELEVEDLLFANKVAKHTKSNTIVLAKNKQLLASGTGQTSRVDALRQAIQKAKNFDFSLQGAVMASDAFFPFPDCVEIAHLEGINAVIQPGGSIKDELSIAYCDDHDMKMVMTGVRHFKH